MATRFATQFARTGAVNLSLQFGETIEYYNRAGDPVRVVQAMIDRNVEVISEAGVPGHATIIRVQDDSTSGITSTEIDTGGDEVAYARRVGEDRKRRAVVRVESTENGLVRFMVQ